MRKRFSLIFICLLVLLTSCVKTTERSYVSTEIIYSEPTAQYSLGLNMDFAETKYAKYYFESSIDNKEREACINATGKVLSNQIVEGNVPEIYVFSQNRYNSKYISNRKLYCSIQNWKSVEYIADVLLTVYGESAHYGSAFGYANYLAKSYRWEYYPDNFQCPSDQSILDLNYLCFDEDFASSSDVSVAKGIACGFVDSYISKYGEQPIQQLLYSHIQSMEALTSYYTENEIFYIPSAVQYGYGGKSYDYIVYSDYGTFYVANDWVDTNADYNPLITDGFLHANYSDTKAFFETNIAQMKQYQDLFKLDDYNNYLDIVFTMPISASKYSFYQSVNHRIYVYNVDSLMHEYIHSLTMPTTSMANWQVEGFARYFSYYYDFYGVAFLNQDYNNTPNTSATKWVHEYLATIDRQIDMAKDYCQLENIAVYSRSYTNPNASYVAGSSFIQYLVRQYGEEAVINHIYGNGNPLPKAYTELVNEWNEFIEKNYSAYSKYK